MLEGKSAIVTGGASAAYGSDAVAGVVNFILNTDFEGVRGHAQVGASSRGDAEHHELSVSAGLDFGDRTRLLLSADTYANEGVAEYQDRPWHQSWGLVRNPDRDGPFLAAMPNVVATNYTYGGLIPSGPLAGTQFLENGEPAPFDTGDNAGRSTQLGGDGVDVARGDDSGIRSVDDAAGVEALLGLVVDLDAGQLEFGVT